MSPLTTNTDHKQKRGCKKNLRLILEGKQPLFLAFARRLFPLIDRFYCFSILSHLLQLTQNQMIIEFSCLLHLHTVGAHEKYISHGKISYGIYLLDKDISPKQALDSIPRACFYAFTRKEAAISSSFIQSVYLQPLFFQPSGLRNVYFANAKIIM